MTVSNVGQLSHISEADVINEVIHFEEDQVLISDECAVTIAGYFASPGAVDMAYTRLAQTGYVDTEALGFAILQDQTVKEIATDPVSPRLLRALDTWVSYKEG